MLKFNAKVGEWGSGLRFKSRIFRICLYLIKKGHQPGVYVPLRALFLVSTLSPSFLIGSSSFLQVTRTTIKAWMGSNLGRIPPLPLSV